MFFTDETPKLKALAMNPLTFYWNAAAPQLM